MQKLLGKETFLRHKEQIPVFKQTNKWLAMQKTSHAQYLENGAGFHILFSMTNPSLPKTNKNIARDFIFRYHINILFNEVLE